MNVVPDTNAYAAGLAGQCERPLSAAGLCLPSGRLQAGLEYFGRVMLLFYLVISAVTPLSTVHVEGDAASLCWSAGHEGSEAGPVLVRLHEMLFRHFSDRVDHVTFSRGLCFERPAADICMDSGEAPYPPRQHDAALTQAGTAYVSRQEGINPPADGFRLFFSSLSPPAA